MTVTRLALATALLALATLPSLRLPATAAAAAPTLALHGAPEMPDMMEQLVRSYALSQTIPLQITVHPDSSSAATAAACAGTAPLAMSVLPPTTSACVGGLAIPIAIDAEAVIYHLPGSYFATTGANGPVHPLRLTPQVIQGIYGGRIRRWDDAALHALNPGAPLPHTPIHAYRSVDANGADGGGTLLRLWMDGGELQQPTRWSMLVRTASVSGVATAVQSTAMSIGFTDLTHLPTSSVLPVAALRNASGRFVVPSRGTLTHALHGVIEQGMPLNFTRPLVESPDPAAYGPSYLLFLRTHRDLSGTPGVTDDVAPGVRAFLQWMVQPTGGQSALQQAAVAPLPCTAPPVYGFSPISETLCQAAQQMARSV